MLEIDPAIGRWRSKAHPASELQLVRVYAVYERRTNNEGAALPVDEIVHQAELDLFLAENEPAPDRPAQRPSTAAAGRPQ